MSIQFQPAETARWCDWPVNHADLIARLRDLRLNEESIIEQLCANPEWCDPKRAGYWIWCASCGIGTWYKADKQRPAISDKGTGINAINSQPIADWFTALATRLRRVRVV
ncbi:MAG: hypothetical protein ABIH03_08000, partial [Pseudomonadota bacterium]